MVVQTLQFSTILSAKRVPLSTQFFYSMFPRTSSFANLGRLQGLSMRHFLHEVFLNPAMQTPSFFRDLRTSFGTTVRTLFLFSSTNIPTFFCLFQPNCKSRDDSIQLTFSLFIKVHSKLQIEPYSPNKKHLSGLFAMESCVVS